MTVFGDCRDYRGIVRRRWPGEVKFVAHFARDTQNSQARPARGLGGKPKIGRARTRCIKLCWRRDFTSSHQQAFRLICQRPELCAVAVGFLLSHDFLSECCVIVPRSASAKSRHSTNTRQLQGISTQFVSTPTHTTLSPPICNEEIIFASFLATSYVRDAVSGVSVI